MRSWHRLRELWRTLFRGTQVHRDIDDELSDWVETIVARHVARGVPREEARRLAAMELGGVAQVKEHAVAVRNGSQWESTWVDVRYAVRALRRSPGFTVASALTFALGIGATTAIFSVVKTILIEPLPYREADRLAFIWADLTDLGYPHAPLAGPELTEFQERTTSFERLGGVWATNATLVDHGDPEHLRIATVTPDFFTTLGVDAALGRALDAGDVGLPITPLLLSHALWTRSFGADPGVLGRKVTLSGGPAMVIGVMPASFELLFPPDAGVPTDLQAWIPGAPRLAQQPRGQQYLRVVARLKDDVRMAGAIADVAAVGAAVIAENPGAYSPGSRFYTVGMKEDTVRQVRPVMLAVFGGVVILLVIACVNIAGLLVVRASERRRETSVRLALGSSASRLLRQCVVEGLLLAGMGGALGVAVAWGGLQVLLLLAPPTLPRVHETDLDAGVLAFAAIASIAWGLAFSLLPWLEVRRYNLSAALQQGGRLTAGKGAIRLRDAMVVAQIALGVVLLVAAALLAQSFDRLMRLDPGFQTDRSLTFRISPPPQRYRPLDGMNAFHRDLTARLRAVPGVSAVGAISHLPYDNLPNWGTPYLPLDETDGSKAGLADTRTVSPGFFEAVGATMIAGRTFSEADTRTTALPVVIDDLMATRLFGGDAPLGRRFKSDLAGAGQMLPMEVIGVVRHLRHRTLMEPGREQLFVSSRFWPRSQTSYVIRTAVAPTAVSADVRRAVRDLDAAVPLYDMRELDSYVEAARAPARFTTALAVVFAGAALVLACLAVYGVMAYTVTLREREFGIRQALGAERRLIVSLVMAEACRLGAVGVITGVGAALLLSRLLSVLLFGITPWNAAAYTAALGTLILAVLVAAWVPARRAAALSPIQVLRSDL